MSRTIAALGGLLLAITTSGSSQSSCPPPVPDSATTRYGQVLIDGKKVGGLVKVKRENADPETYEIVDPEPAALKALPVAKIDLIQYLRGKDAERQYHLCPSAVAIVITTKKAARGARGTESPGERARLRSR